MIYLVNNFANFVIFLLIIGYSWKIKPREIRYQLMSVASVLLASYIDYRLDGDLLPVYILYNYISVLLFFDFGLLHAFNLIIPLMFFTGMIDTFSSIFIQIVFIGHGVAENNISWWMEPAYLISLTIYYILYRVVLKKNNVYMCDIKIKYKIEILVFSIIFQMFYSIIFSSLDEHNTEFTVNAYIMFVIALVGAIYSVALTLELATKNIVEERQNRELEMYINMQEQSYDYQKEKMMEISKFRHDLLNHMTVIRELLKQNNCDKAVSYIDSVWDLVTEFGKNIRTGDDILDVIINYYYLICSRDNISFKLVGGVSKKIDMGLTDITKLISNILQNAYEAARQSEKKFIVITVYDAKNEVFIKAINSSHKDVIKKDGRLITSKKDSKLHGFGINNIQDIVNKYNGECYYGTDKIDNEYVFEINVSVRNIERC